MSDTLADAPQTLDEIPRQLTQDGPAQRLYIVDESGQISYKGGNGPFKYDPKEVRAWLAQRYGEVKHPEPAPAEKKS